MKKSLGELFWILFTIFIVLTWVLWFFEIDIRDVKPEISNKISEIKTNLQNVQNVQNNIGETTQKNMEKTSIENKDILLEQCRQSFEECKSISIQKYEIPIRLLKIEKFEDEKNINEFFDTWEVRSTFNYLDKATQYNLFYNINLSETDSFPLVLIASNVGISLMEDSKTPMVLICSKEGNLLDYSKLRLGC